MYDSCLITATAVLGLLSHLSKTRNWLALILRAMIFVFGLIELSFLFVLSFTHHNTFAPRNMTVLMFLFPLTWLILFMPFRKFVSSLLTGLNFVITGQVLLPYIRKDLKIPLYFSQKRIFNAESFPHLIALFIYITVTAYFLIGINDQSTFPRLYKILPVTSLSEHFLSHNGIVLILLSICGVGLFITRNGKQTLQRLGLTKPNLPEIIVAIFLILASFTYDGLWAIYTHHLAGQDLATELSGYHSGSFTIVDSFILAFTLTAIFSVLSGISEEILIRGAVQPVFGILPSALIHGMLHAHIAHVPILMIKVTIWSIFVGFLRRYTNTTTAILGHAGFNLLTIFLFGCNP